jgi:sugar phosphate isomerase/epimerase
MTTEARCDPSRRSFLFGASFLTGLGGAAAALAARRAPIGLELYSLRDEVKTDVSPVLRQVARIGYEVVEHYSLYWEYTPEQIQAMRKLLDELKIRCVSTHNSGKYLLPENLQKTIEYNQALGATQIIQASAGRIGTAKGWMAVAENLTNVAAKLKPLGLRTGFHNHGEEFKPVEGKLPIDILGENTPKDVILQLDVGACLSAGGDPVAFMKRYPGRIASMHVKDWSPEPGRGFRVLLGEGAVNWKEVLSAGDSIGGVEYYIIEQEGADLPPMKTVELCFQTLRKLRA